MLLTPITAAVVAELVVAGTLRRGRPPFTLDRFALAAGGPVVIIHVNGEPRDVTRRSGCWTCWTSPTARVAPRGVAVAVDGEVVPRSRHAETLLSEGARVEIVTAVQGG